MSRNRRREDTVGNLYLFTGLIVTVALFKCIWEITLFRTAVTDINKIIGNIIHCIIASIAALRAVTKIIEGVI